MVTEKYELHKKFNENFPTERNDQPGLSYPFSEKEEFINKITSQLNPNIELILCKISSFEGLRLIYQPLLARMQIMEKCIIGGISVTDIYRIEKEFDFLQKAINSKEKYLISIDFYNKLGDILYFKTGRIKPKHPLVDPCIPEDSACRQNDFINQYFDEKKKENPIPNIYNAEKSKQCFNEQKKGNTIPKIDKTDKDYELSNIPIECSACLFYTKGLLIFIEQLMDLKNKEIHTIKDVLLKITENYDYIITKDYTTIRILAGLISDLGDVQLSCKSIEKSKIEVKKLEEFLQSLFQETSPENENKLITSFRLISDTGSVEGIIYQYYLSAKLYKKINEAKLYVWHLTRILHLLKQILQSSKYGRPSQLKASITELELTIFRLGMTNGNKVNELKGLYDKLYEKDFINTLEKELMAKCIRGSWAAYEYSQFAEIQKMKSTFSRTGERIDPESRVTLSRLSISSDINESVILFSEICILPDDIILFPKTQEGVHNDYYLKGKAVDFYCRNSISPFSDSKTIYDRLLRLNFKVKLNYRIFSAIHTKFFHNEKSTVNRLPVEYGYDKIEYLTNLFYGLRKLLPVEREKFSDAYLPKTPIIHFNSSDYSNLKEREFLSPSLVDLYIHLIADSIFCLNEIIEVVNAYGKSYILNHSFLASAHEKMILWAMIYSAITNVSENSLSANNPYNLKNLDADERHELLEMVKNMKKRLNELLRKWMDDDAMQSITMVYHCEMAIRRYNAALETHSQGKAYKNFIENMSFLNDDFNDKIAHFFVGLERFKINERIIYQQIDKLKKLFKESSLYKPIEYTITHLN